MQNSTYTVSDSANTILNRFSVTLTGARRGDILTGVRPRSKDAVIKILTGNISPRKPILDILRSSPLLWRQYLLKLATVKFFSCMTVYEREQWLLENEKESQAMCEGENETFILLEPGASDFGNVLTTEDLNRLMYPPGGGVTAFDVYKVFPRKPGSRAPRQTLIMYKAFWRIAVNYEVRSKFKGVVIDVEKGLLFKGLKVTNGNGDSKEIVVLRDITAKVEQRGGRWIRASIDDGGTQDIGMLVSRNTPKALSVGDHGYVKLLKKCGVTSVFSKLINKAFSHFTPAGYKSLLQKIIRFRPKFVWVLGCDILAIDVLCVAMLNLLIIPGSFVPDIQRYVSGLESFAKRLAVICFEDSYGDVSDMLSLLSGALLAQRVKVWKPSLSLIHKWIKIGLGLYHETRTIVYTKKSLEPYILGDCNIIEACSALLDELKSFPTDIAMVRNIAYEYSDYRFVESVVQPRVMPLGHCVDFHWLPIVGLFYSTKTVTDHCNSNTSLPFKGLFTELWRKSSGLNPRRHSIDFKRHSLTPFVKETRNAQRLVLLSRSDVERTESECTSLSFYTLHYRLEVDWLAGMIGALEVPGNPPALITPRSDNPMELFAIRRPSREMKSGILSDERHAEAIARAHQMLERGVKLNKCKPPHNELRDSEVFLRDKVYYIVKSNGTELEWDKARNIDIKIPKLPPIDWEDVTLELAFTGPDMGLRRNYKELIVRLLDDTSVSVLRRVLTYINSYSSEFEMNRISRDGGGTYQKVLVSDVGAFQFFLKLSVIAPVAIRPKPCMPGSFLIPVGPALWSIRRTLVKKLICGFSKKSGYFSSGWPVDSRAFRDTLKRKLWSHQLDALNDMKSNHLKGYRGNFLSLPLGSGKTLIVLKFVRYLFKRGILPKYIVYTLPSSAIASIIHEVSAFGLNINVVVPVKKTLNVDAPQSREFVPFCVNLVEHDYLRRCENQLGDIATQSVVIIDEVHKALNSTQRTSVALQISNLATQFIALTGTPVIDSNTYKLIAWLKQVVNFEVNERNFWVAANSMIAKKFSTGVNIRRRDVEIQLSDEQSKKYNRLVPPELGGGNHNPTYDDFAKATTLSYETCNSEMIRQTCHYLRSVKRRGVMLIAKDVKHQAILYDLLTTSKDAKVSKDSIFMIKGNDSLFLSDDAVNNGSVPDYRVVIVPIRKAEGYTLTRLSVVITSVYPSNQATREQLEGRINRIGQKEKDIYYVTVHAGILTRLLYKHADAKSLSLALQSLANEIS